jgi:hypothetical protein
VRPNLLDEAIVPFSLPFLGEEVGNFVTPFHKGGSVAPDGSGSVGHFDFMRIAGIPGIFGHAHLLNGSFQGKGWDGRLFGGCGGAHLAKNSVPHELLFYEQCANNVRYTNNNEVDGSKSAVIFGTSIL